jgi:hypothetical protein
VGMQVVNTMELIPTLTPQLFFRVPETLAIVSLTVLMLYAALMLGVAELVVLRKVGSRTFLMLLLGFVTWYAVVAFAVAGYDIGSPPATMILTLSPVRIDFVELCVVMAYIVFGLSALMTLRWLPVGAVNRTNEPTLSVSTTSNMLLMGLRDLGIVAAFTIGGLVLEMPTYDDVHLENLRFKLPVYVYGKAVSEDEAQVPLRKDPAGPFEAEAEGLEHFFSLYQSVGPIIWKT